MLYHDKRIASWIHAHSSNKRSFNWPCSKSDLCEGYNVQEGMIQLHVISEAIVEYAVQVLVSWYQENILTNITAVIPALVWSDLWLWPFRFMASHTELGLTLLYKFSCKNLDSYHAASEATWQPWIKAN